VVAHKSGSGTTDHFFLMAAPYRACAGSARRPLQQGGFAAFSLCRVHPSSWGRDYGYPKNLLEKTGKDTFVHKGLGAFSPRPSFAISIC